MLVPGIRNRTCVIEHVRVCTHHLRQLNVMIKLQQCSLPSELMSHTMQFCDAVSLYLMRSVAKSVGSTFATARVCSWPAVTTGPKKISQWRQQREGHMMRGEIDGSYLTENCAVRDALSSSIGSVMRRFAEQGDALGTVALMEWWAL